MKNHLQYEQPDYEGGGMTPRQKQAAIVCAVCALALVLTAGITGVLVSQQIRSARENGNGLGSDEGYNGSGYVISGDAILPETDDAGEDYITDTVFIGDSNTVRMYNSSLITLQQFCAQEGLAIEDANSKKIVAFSGESSLHTIPDAVAVMKPRRVLITLGTNDGSGNMSTADFTKHYKKLIEAIQSKYPYTDIIVNSVPPVPQAHSKYGSMNQSAIDQYNMALASLCDELNVKFLNSAEALKDESGFGNVGYYNENDIHFTLSGMKAMLNYYRTHAYTSDDRRPDTDNVLKRVEGGTSSVPASSASSASSGDAVDFTASYYVDSSGGGTLSCGSDTGKTSLQYDVSSADASYSVMAVPNSGYFFLKWSDGVQSASRTDTNFQQNVNVTAVFGTLSLSIAADNGTTSIVSGGRQGFAATMNSKYASSSSIDWYVDGTKTSTGSNYMFTSITPGTFKVTAGVTVNGTTIYSNAVSITVTGPAAPSVSVSLSSQSVTEGTPVTMTASFSSGNYNVTWYHDNGEAIGTGNPLTYNLPSGTYRIYAMFDFNGTQVQSANSVTVTVSQAG